MYPDKCKELGFIEPLAGDTQESYIIRLMVNGLSINTREARYIGIYNLHSVASNLDKKQVPFSLGHVVAACPETGTTPRHPVDEIWMDDEDLSEYLEMKKGSKH